MSEPVDSVADESAGRTPAAPAFVTAGDEGRPCPRCHVRLSPAYATARFCPRCGATLAASAAAEPVASGAPHAANPIPLAAVARHDVAALAEAWRQVAGAQAPPPSRAAVGGPSDDDSHSLMLLGYANAMYRLGWRYETGMGTGRNTEEAIRCYFKAAKLGNPAALARLAPRCMAGDPHDPRDTPKPREE